MDYETADGAQFSLREIVSEDRGLPEFQETLITAFVDGNAYAGKSEQRMEELDDVDVIEHLEPLPPENVFPKLPESFTVAPPFDIANHYLKAPQFTYDDKHPGNTFVADTLLHEAKVLEQLMKRPHPSIATYYGAVLKDGRITHLCLKRCICNLAEYYQVEPTKEERERILKQVKEGVEHIHSFGLAHNDINPENICIDSDGHAVIVDFDSCQPFGEPLRKGVALQATLEEKAPVSSREVDAQGFERIREFLFSPEQAVLQAFSEPISGDVEPSSVPRKGHKA